jgi:hypothetical protein
VDNTESTSARLLTDEQREDQKKLPEEMRQDLLGKTNPPVPKKKMNKGKVVRPKLTKEALVNEMLKAAKEFGIPSAPESPLLKPQGDSKLEQPKTILDESEW